MPFLIILIFLGIPILEIAVFIQAGEIFGLWPTLAAIVVTAVVGATLIRAQGMAALHRARQSLARDRIPVSEVFTGICLLIAGALLLTPGFVTDTVGFLLLVPPLRAVLGRWILTAAMRSRNTRMWVNGEEIVTPQRERERKPADAIDVDYTDVTDDRDGRGGKTGR